jgi:hypothetical protein
MDAKLQVIGGKASKNIVSLTLPATIGRGKDASLTIAHPLISRQHCRLYETEGLLMLQDLESTNGTYLQGRRIRQAPLPPETEFSIGPLTFRVQYQYAGNLSALPAPVFSEEAKSAAAEIPDFEAVEEEIDFLLPDDEETQREPPANSTAQPGNGSPQSASQAQASSQDLSETTTLPPIKKNAPQPSAPTAKDNTPPQKAPNDAGIPNPKPTLSPSAQPSGEPTPDEISDEEFEKFFDNF